MDRDLVCLVSLERRYFEYATNVAAPVTRPMTKLELFEFVRCEEGWIGLQELPERLERVKARGHSALAHYANASVQELLAGNRAGPEESEWTLDQFKAWCRGDEVLE